MGDIADSHLDDMMFEECEFCGAIDCDPHDEDCPLLEFDDIDDSEDEQLDLDESEEE